MSVASKFHHASDKVTASVSQGTRRDANAEPSIGRYDTYKEEYDALVMRKRELEQVLSLDFCKTAYLTAQAKIRREYSGNRSLSEWIKVRAEMDKRRGRVIEEKTEVERRLSQLKPKIKAENISLHSPTGDGVAINYGEQLVAIRILLEKIASRLGATK